MQDSRQYSKLNQRFNPWSLSCGVPEHLSQNVETEILIVVFSDWFLQVSLFTFLDHQFYIVKAARIPLGFLHDPAFSGGQSSSSYLSKHFMHSVKEEVQKETSSSGKTTYLGPPRRGSSFPVPLYLGKERLWSNIAMQIQNTTSSVWKWTYPDTLLIKHALVKRQNICREYFIWSNWGCSFVCRTGLKPGSGNLLQNQYKFWIVGYHWTNFSPSGKAYKGSG